MMMSYSPKLSTYYNHTKNRTGNDVCDLSGMCSVCTDQCIGTCEIGLSAVRGVESTYPYQTTTQQFASEKKYPFDYSHFNINGRVFGAVGITDYDEFTNVYSVDTTTEIGVDHKIPVRAPFILPAIAKLDWRDYYAGAAMFGIPVVIGENAVRTDKETVFSNQKVVKAPVINRMEEIYRNYQDGYGDIIFQANMDDITLGSPECVLKNTNIKCIEIKLGQAAKGIQHMAVVQSLEDARALKQKGYFVHPDPEDERIAEAYAKHHSFHFYEYGRLPFWTEEKLEETIRQYRELGAEHILIKMAGYDEEDIVRTLEIGSANEVSLITFDGAGGGTGHSPCKMMNEWGMPVIELEQVLWKHLKKLDERNCYLPKIALAGGFTTEDRVFKALALGENYVNLIAIGRGAMAAAMSAKNLGELIKNQTVPEKYRQFGTSVEEIFFDAPMLMDKYGKDISTGAIGVYSYLDRINTGLKQLMTLNRKFSLSCLNRSDLIPLTPEARRILGQ